MERALYVVAARLSSTYQAWNVERGVVKGPGTLAVRVEDQHHMGANHFDIGFVLNRERADIPVLWDCVAGMGSTSDEVLDRAVETWAASTLPVCLELVNRDGSFADHYDNDDPEGCPGWHVIHGPLLAFGIGTAPEVLQAWTLKNPLLPVIGPLAVKTFNRPTLNCVKVLFGSGDEEVVEVRVNGLCDQNTSERLKSLAWPRSAEAAFARCFLLFVHSDEGENSDRSLVLNA
jgi:hypothetical protein